MAFEQKEGSGALFRNQRKQKESQPDFQGSVKHKGETIKLAGWTRESKSGLKFISLSVDKNQRQEANNDDDIF